MGEQMNEHRISEVEKDVAELKIDLKDYQKDNERWKRNNEDRSSQHESRILIMEQGMTDIKGLLKFIRNTVITILLGGILTLLANIGG